MTTANLTDVLSSAVLAKFGVNTHWKDDGSAYRDPANPTEPNPNAEAVVTAFGPHIWRERFNNLHAQNTAIVDLRPMVQFGQSGNDVNTNDTDIRAMIHAVATSSRKGDVYAFTGANEPNDRSGTSQTWTDPDGTGRTMAQQVVFQQYAIWDQVMIEVGAGNWTATPGVAGGRPYVVGPGVKHEHVPLDTDIAALAAATYTTAGIVYHLADLCDFGDMHFYPGYKGPGFRMNGKDDNGNVPPGVVLSVIDGKAAQSTFELQRFRQIYDLKLTGGSGALVSGHWKYTGGTVTSGHGTDFAMCHSEWGYDNVGDSQHTDGEALAWGALAGPETLLRDLYAGPVDTVGQRIRASIVYQAVNDRGSDPEKGVYNLTDYPAGNYPIYDALQTLCTYPGSTTFVGVGAFQDIGGHLPDCTGLAFSESATEWWLYILRRADTAAHLTLAAAYTVESLALNGDGTYHLDLSAPLTILHVVPIAGGGGVPVFTGYAVPNRGSGVSVSYTLTASGSPTSWAVASGALPTGWSLNTSTGAITGTSSTPGTYTVGFSATNGSGTGLSPSVNVIIWSAPVFTADSPPLTGTVGVAYGTTGDGYVYAATSYPAAYFTLGGTAVPGLTLSSDGTYSGTPTTAGSYTNHAIAAFSEIILGSPVSGGNHTIVIAAGGGGSPGVPEFTVPPPPPPDGIQGEAYDYRFRADDPNGVEDPTFSVASGTIPPGMVLSSGGHLKSKPLVKGTYTFAIAATNSAGTATTADLTINVVDNGDHGAGQTITYALAGPNSAISAYVWFKGSTIAEDKSARFHVFQDVNANALFVVRVKQSGKLDIDDVDGNSLAKGEPFRALFDTDESARWRASYVIGWDGAKATLIFRPYGDLESTQESDFLFAQVASTVAPYQVEMGNKTGEVDMTTDTVTVSGLAQEIPPYAPEGSGTLAQLFTLTGGATSTSFMANSRMSLASATKSVDLVYSTSADLSSPSLAGSVTIDADGMAKHAPFGLTADTRYYAQLKDPLTGLMVGEKFSCKTLPASSGAWTRNIAVVSCQNNPQQGALPQLAWQDILGWAPDDIWHLGDWGYWGGTLKASEPYTHDLQKYDKVAAQVTSQRAALHGAGLPVVTISDHELHDNGDDWDGKGTEDPTGAFNCPHSVRQLPAHQVLFPIRTYGDSRVPKRHRGYTFDMGSSVRVIVTDFRSPDRSNAADANTPAKQMWGATQEAWLFAQFDATKVNILVNETSNWFDVGGLRATDKPAAYPDAQTRLNDKINGTGDYAGGPVYSVLWVGGDRHYCGFLSGASNTFGGFPQVISSGLFKNALELQSNELMDWITLNPTNTVDKFAVCQYQRMKLEYDGIDTVTMTVYARVADTTRPVTDGHTIVNTTAITSNQALFTQSDVGQLIAGDGIRNQTTKIVNGRAVTTDTPTFIATVTDSTHATITQAATSTQSAGAWTIQNAQNLWQMQDFPGGTPTSVSWTEAGGAGTVFTPDWMV